DATNGAGPYYGPLVQGRDGNLWGTTSAGGANGGGTIFKMTPDGSLTTVYSFCPQANCADGYYPVAGLVLGKDGNFYGTTLMGGDENGCDFPQGCGVLFKITPKGGYTVLHTYGRGDLAAGPIGGLMQATNGSFYGDGGLDNGGMAVYRITSSGAYTELASWDLSTAGHPYGGLIQATDGSLYGTTNIGGTGSCNDGCGTVFKINTNGKKMLILHSFDITDGENPVAGLLQADDGNFYGAAALGGTNFANCECGTLFEITSTGVFNKFYDFCSQADCSDGFAPFGTLIQATDGNFYGTTYQGGGLYGNGTIYEWNPTAQSFSVIYTFPQNSGTVAGLVQATNGKFFGTNVYGGNSPNCSYGCGAIFSLDLGLGPFVRPVTYSGKVGTTVEILGQGFNKSTTSVSFNGTAATRTVVSGNYLTAKVPAGATTGYVTVTTGAVTLTSDKVFRVTP
ncbi:MAG: choice-of-anchor tandem repeat GloVer-containing protein, partial [Terriglobales bacterium]